MTRAATEAKLGGLELEVLSIVASGVSDPRDKYAHSYHRFISQACGRLYRKGFIDWRDDGRVVTPAGRAALEQHSRDTQRKDGRDG